MLAGELPQPVTGAGRRGQHRLAGQVTLHVQGKTAGGLVPPRAVLLQCLHHDPIQLPADQFRQPRRLRLPAGSQRGQRLAGTQPQARPRRLFLADDAANLLPGRLLESLLLQRRRPGQQLVEQDPQGIQVRAGVDVEVVELRLFRRHVQAACPAPSRGRCAA